MRYLLLLLCTGIVCLANAQKKMVYTGSVEGGLLRGSSPASSFVFTTQGVAYKRYTFGIGGGLDFYRFSSIPLFVDIKRKWSDKKIQPYLNAAAGINFANRKNDAAEEFYKYSEGKLNNGFFAKGSGGLIFNAQKKIKFSLSAGYSYKTASYSYKPFNGTPWAWQMQPLKDIYHYNRWYAGVGIMW